MRRSVRQRLGRRALSLGCSIAILAAAGTTPAYATELEIPEWLAFVASERARGEFVDWFRPPPGDAAPGAEQYNFFGNQLRLGIRATFPHVQLGIDVQDTRLANLPDDASLPAPFGSLGPGASYFANTAKTSQGETFLKRGFLTLRRAGASATLGRFEIREGLETLPADPTLLVLKRERIAERLVGPFGFSHVTRSFDGVQASFDRPLWNVTAFGSVPTQGGFEVSANTEIDQITVAGFAVTGKRIPGAPPIDLRAFYLYYDDTRSDVVKVDNRPLDVRQADQGLLGIHTTGAHALTAFEAGPGAVDLLGWGALQHGRWGNLDQWSWAWALEAGYQLYKLPTRPWLRVGWDRSSGDDDPFDDEHGTFFQLIPTARIYAQLPFYNLMNSSDVFTQLILQVMEPVALKLGYHWLEVTEGNDLWYQGSGATKRTIFGYSGSPANGHRPLAHMVDVSLSVELFDHMVAQAYYGHAFGQSVVEQTFAGTDASYGFLEVLVFY
jgi:hypothetical protein